MNIDIKEFLKNNPTKESQMQALGALNDSKMYYKYARYVEDAPLDIIVNRVASLKNFDDIILFLDAFPQSIKYLEEEKLIALILDIVNLKDANLIYDFARSLGHNNYDMVFAALLISLKSIEHIYAYANFNDLDDNVKTLLLKSLESLNYSDNLNKENSERLRKK